MRDGAIGQIGTDYINWMELKVGLSSLLHRHQCTATLITHNKFTTLHTLCQDVHEQFQACRWTRALRGLGGTRRVGWRLDAKSRTTQSSGWLTLWCAWLNRSQCSCCRQRLATSPWEDTRLERALPTSQARAVATRRAKETPSSRLVAKRRASR